MALAAARGSFGQYRAVQARGLCAGARRVSRAALIAAAVLGVTRAPAQALSCLPQDVARVYQEAAAAEQAYLVVHGRLTFDEGALPRTNWQDQAATPPLTRIPARISGVAVGPAGMGPRFDRSITLEIRCLGPWCAGARSGAEYLAFLERREAGYALLLDPCGGMGLADPSPEVLGRVRACLAGGACLPD